MSNVTYLVEGGEVFEGTAQQLDDCFGIDPSELDDWCAFHNWTWEKVIREYGEADPLKVNDNE